MGLLFDVIAGDPARSSRTKSATLRVRLPLHTSTVGTYNNHVIDWVNLHGRLGWSHGWLRGWS
jgi:hypothetical protein